LGKRRIGESVMVSWEWSEMDAGISKTYTEMCFPKSEFGKESMKRSEFGKEGNSENRSLGKRGIGESVMVSN